MNIWVDAVDDGQASRHRELDHAPSVNNQESTGGSAEALRNGASIIHTRLGPIPTTHQLSLPVFLPVGRTHPNIVVRKAMVHSKIFGPRGEAFLKPGVCPPRHGHKVAEPHV